MPKRGISRFPVKNLLSQNTEKLLRGTLLCPRKMLIAKNFMDKRGEGVSRISLKLFSQCQKILQWIPLVCHYIRVWKKILLERVRSGFSVEIALSDSAEIFRRGTLLCRRKFRISKKILDKSGVGNHDTPSKLFCLTVPNFFIDEPFCVSEQFVLRKILCQ